MAFDVGDDCIGYRCVHVKGRLVSFRECDRDGFNARRSIFSMPISRGLAIFFWLCGRS